MIWCSTQHSFVPPASTYSNPADFFLMFSMYQSCHDEEDDDGEEEVKSFEVRWIFLDLSFFFYFETLFHSL